MKHTSIVMGLLAAIGTTLGVLIALAGLPYGRVSTTVFAGPIHNATPAPGVHLAIDCDVFTAGVQDSCNVYGYPYSSFVVNAVFQDNMAAGDIGAVKVTIRNRAPTSRRLPSRM